MSETAWDILDEKGAPWGHQFKTKAEAEAFMDEYHDKKYSEMRDLEDGEWYEDEYTIALLDLDAGRDDEEIKEKYTYTASYCHEKVRSDYDEHNTHWGL